MYEDVKEAQGIRIIILPTVLSENNVTRGQCSLLWSDLSLRLSCIPASLHLNPVSGGATEDSNDRAALPFRCHHADDF